MIAAHQVAIRNLGILTLPSVASLPMYELPETRAFHDAWWKGLRSHFLRAGIAGVPTCLSRPTALPDHWLDGSLLFSQTCGYPLTHALRGRLTLLGTPAYRVPGCRGIDYSSAILVNAGCSVSRLEALRGTVAACNAADSHSGYNALRILVAPLARDGRFFSAVRISGSHADSAALVGSGRADVCAVDAVSYALLERYSPEALQGTRLLAWSAFAPGLPYVTRHGLRPSELARLREGIAAACADPQLEEVRAALFLDGFECPGESEYERIIEQESAARRLGYPELG